MPPHSSALPGQFSGFHPQSSNLQQQSSAVSHKSSALQQQPSTSQIHSLLQKSSMLPQQSSTSQIHSSPTLQKSSMVQQQSSMVQQQSSTSQIHSSPTLQKSSMVQQQSSTSQIHSSATLQKSSMLQQQSSTSQVQPSTFSQKSLMFQQQTSISQIQSSGVPQKSSMVQHQPSASQIQSSGVSQKFSILQQQSSTSQIHSSALQQKSPMLQQQPLQQISPMLQQQPSNVQIQSATLQQKSSMPYPTGLPQTSSSLQLQNSTLQPQSSASPLNPSTSVPQYTTLLPRSSDLQSHSSAFPSQSSYPPTQSSNISSHSSQPADMLRETLPSPAKPRFFKQHGISPWSCEYCNKYYKSRDTLQKHKKYFCPHKSTCNKCKGVFNNVIELAIHQKSHLRVNILLPEESLFPCTICNKKFAARSMLHMHKKMHEKFNHLQNPSLQPEKQFQCPHCPRAYVKKFNLQVHMKVHMPLQGEALQNNQNEGENIVPENLESGENAANKKEDELDESTPQWKQKCNCKYCGHVCADSNALWMHMVQQHSSDQAFRCNKCGKEFNQQQAFLAHKKTMCVKVRCKICGKMYASPKALREHEWNKHGVERATHHCRLCRQSFVTRSALLIHGRVHHIEKKDNDSSHKVEQQSEEVQKSEEVEPQEENLNLPCKICLRVFTSHEALQRHIKIHATGKHVFYPCEVCGKKFVSLEMYKTHVASHTVSQSFHCPRCNKLFFKEEVLKNHTCETSGKQYCPNCGIPLTEEELLNHVCGEKVEDVAVPCKQCSAVFSSLKALSCHMRMHKRQNELLASDFKRSCIRMANGLYKCNICGKLTTTQQGAAAHSRWHVGPTPNKPFKCPFCQRKYSSESGLYSHISLEHPESA
ncbi:hypothetical protein L9F63_020824 [Diploptera punctata]|uniref:C2H2-type domain-containing protein n=1 Tax=Diploptera punctata TaxID=6984 RepID=A0AAD7ZQR5_DIPPU|nr:hypothetical protein L9F63_020824 [Diploptera punctata]